MFKGLFARYAKILEKQVCCDKRPLAIKLPPPTNLLVKREQTINSRFTGALTAQGRVVIGPEGLIISNLSLDELEVYGRVRGNITVNHLHLHASAYIDGNITAKSLHIDEGAKVTGTIQLPAAAALISAG